MTGAQVALLPDGRLHLHHGPIDLIVSAEGPDRARAFDAAATRFDGLLDGLVAELERLRRPLAPSGTHPVGPGAGLTIFSDPTARRMAAAVAAFTDTFVTPMAAVAGAVADEILAAMTREASLTRAIVNNGGDIAFHLAPGETLTAASPAGQVRIAHDTATRGLATSGWRGRSHSLGIADAVTVAARTAAEADVAATLVANAVDLPGHPGIRRTPAHDLAPDSDLGPRPVTTGVGPLGDRDIARALDTGEVFARTCVARGLIHAATLTLAGRTRLVTHEKALTHA